MSKKYSSTNIIGFGLAVLYGVCLVNYLQYYKVANFHLHAILLSVLFGILMVCSVAVAQLKEWGRILIIGTNIVLAGYILKLGDKFASFAPWPYALLSFILLLFFTQSRIKRIFRRNNQQEWRSILIIDDDEIHIKTVRPILIKQGFSVLTANTGEIGLEIVQQQKPDLVLLDVILPGIKGREVCKRIKEDKACRHIPVIFLTSKDSPDDIKAEMEVGAETHLTKPVNVKILIATINEVLDPKD